MAQPEVVYEEKDDLYELVAVSRTRSKGYFLIDVGECHDHRSALRAAPNRPAEPAKVIAPRIDEQEYYVDHAGRPSSYIRANDTGRNFRLVIGAGRRVPAGPTGRS